MDDIVKKRQLLNNLIRHHYDREDALVEARKIVNPMIPARLFKFRGVTNGALNNLKRDTLYFALPKTFNDPFDCSLTFEGPDIIEVALKSFNLEAPGLVEMVKSSVDPIAKLVDILARSQGLTHDIDIIRVTGEIRRMLIAPVEHLDEQLKGSCIICSLSERIDSLPMWAHYGNDHRGFAMEYDFQALGDIDELRNSIWPVLYSAERYDVTDRIFGRKVEKFNELFVLGGALCKSFDWQYEHEWRIVKHVGSNAIGKNVSVPIPVAIYIGAQVAPHHVKALRKMAALKGIPAYKMRLSAKEFKMEAEAL